MTRGDDLIIGHWSEGVKVARGIRNGLVVSVASVVAVVFAVYLVVNAIGGNL